MAHAGWRAVFITFGLISLVWLAPWLIATRGRAAIEQVQLPMAPAPSHRAILSRRELWGAAIGHFAAAYPFFLLLTWLPSYLVKAHGYSLAQMGALSGLVYLLSAVCAFVGGLVADRWMARGGASTVVRKTMVAGAGLVSVGAMLACASGQAQFAIAGLLLSAIPNGVASFNCYAIGQTPGRGQPAPAAGWVGRAGSAPSPPSSRPGSPARSYRPPATSSWRSWRRRGSARWAWSPGSGSSRASSRWRGRRRRRAGLLRLRQQAPTRLDGATSACAVARSRG